jgi:hypothetical protein
LLTGENYRFWRYNGALFYQEELLSRVINPDRPGKERMLLSKGIVAAIREMAKQDKPDEKSRDLAAFISLALAAIHKTIDDSVTAWEKRGYWVKADKYRYEWSWSELWAEKMKKAVLDEDWDNVAQISAQIAIKLNKITLPKRNQSEMPWSGAWEKLRKE